MEFRIGVNLGDVVEEKDKLFGDGVNIAARLEGLAEAGGVCISGTAFDQVRNKLNLGYEFRGEQTVKNIAEPVRVYKVLTEPEAAGKVIGERKAPLGISESLNAHYDAIIKTIVEGRVVPFIGEGANLCGRPADRKWTCGRSDTLPSNAELAEHLARNFEYPPSAPLDLVRVSEYVSVVSGSGPLYEELHSLFDADYEPTPLHRFFASLPASCGRRDIPRAIRSSSPLTTTTPSSGPSMGSTSLSTSSSTSPRGSSAASSSTFHPGAMSASLNGLTSTAAYPSISDPSS